MQRQLIVSSCLLCLTTGCATVIEGHERALYYSASQGLMKEPVPSGWHWHLPWNTYRVYDLRFDSHQEEVHIHSKDNLHLNVTVAAVVRAKPSELFELDTEVGPDWYTDLVKPSLLAATRDAAAKLTHLEIAIHTHEFEEGIERALREHLAGKHIDLAQVAIQHFDLPQDVETAANKKAASEQALIARDIELKLAERDAQIDQSRRRGASETAGLERRLKAQQDLEQAELDLKIEEQRRKTQQVRLEAEADATRIRARAEAEATKLQAEAERARISATAANLTPNYVRLKSIEALSKAITGGVAHTWVVPTTKDGLPAYFAPFLNPYGPFAGSATAAGSALLGDDVPKARP